MVHESSFHTCCFILYSVVFGVYVDELNLQRLIRQLFSFPNCWLLDSGMPTAEINRWNQGFFTMFWKLSGIEPVMFFRISRISGIFFRISSFFFLEFWGFCFNFSIFIQIYIRDDIIWYKYHACLGCTEK